MLFKNLTDENKKRIIDSYNNRAISGLTVEQLAIKLSLIFNVSERTIRKWFSEKLNLKEKMEIEPEQYEQAKKRKFDKEKDKFIITWAQNNTKIHKGFYKNIEAYAKEINADIHIILGRYKNPNRLNENSEETWVEEVLKYGDASRHDIHKYVSIMSDVKIQPTAVNPMSGMEGLSGINSCIFGAPKVQMEMIPVLENNKPKMMLSTGALTVKNYSDSKAGKKGEFHHTFGFCIVEIKNKDIFFVRQVTADDKTGDFTDLIYKVENGEVKKISLNERNKIPYGIKTQILKYNICDNRINSLKKESNNFKVV
jgi:transposase